MERDLMEDDRNYSFVSKDSEIDIVRIIEEAPEGTPFILVEEKSRTRRTLGWLLLVHTSVLSDINIQGKFLCCKCRQCTDMRVTPLWGDSEIVSEKGSVSLLHYKAASGPGKFPGIYKQQIEHLRRDMNAKNAETFVSFL